MLIDFNQSLLNRDGSEIPGTKEGEKATLKAACIVALDAEVEGNKLNPSDRIKYNKLANKIYDSAEPIEVATEEISYIKEKLSKIYPTLISGQACEMLERNYVKPNGG